MENTAFTTTQDTDERAWATPTIPFDDAYGVLEKCYRRGNGNSFLEHVKSSLTNRYEPAGTTGIKKFNPYVISVATAVVFIAAVVLYFTLAH